MKKVLSLLFLLMLIVQNASAVGFTTYYRNALIFAYSQANSVYEDDNIKLEIYNENVYATNKTNKTLFIDLSQCFLVHNESSFPMFSEKQNEKKASKKGVSTSIDEFITIAPSMGKKQNETFIVSLTAQYYYGEYNTVESPSGEFSEYDERLMSLVSEIVEESRQSSKNGKECSGTVYRHLTEDESVSTYGASLAYGFNKKSDEWTNITISTWVDDVIFAPYFVEVPEELTLEERRGFSAKGQQPLIVHVKGKCPFEFDEDRSPLIAADWEGKFKEGTFTLEPIRVKDDKYAKRILSFDGEDAKWGKMYHTNSKYNTRREFNGY